MSKKTSNALIFESEAKRLLRKIYDRASGNDPLNEGYQTRLDSDIFEEIEAFLQINEKQETRPD